MEEQRIQRDDYKLQEDFSTVQKVGVVQKSMHSQYR